MGREVAIRRLMALQLEAMDEFFPDSADLQTAFEEFGMGVLFDAKLGADGARRRPPERFIYMMDGSPDTCVGYHRWHAFIRAAVAVGVDQDRLLRLDRPGLGDLLRPRSAVGRARKSSA